MDGLFDSFARLDSRISSVGQTAAKIGDHLQVLKSVICFLHPESINYLSSLGNNKSILFVLCIN